MNKILFIAPLTSYHGQGKVSIMAKEVLEGDNKLHVINTFSENHTFSKITFNLRIIFKILVSSYNYDFVYFTPSRRLLSSFRDFFLIIKFRSKTKIISHIHGSELYEFLNQKGIYYNRLRRLHLKYTYKCLILSESHKKYSLGEEFLNYKIIPNPCEIKRTEELIPKSSLSFCTISNPIAEKGLDTIIKKLNTFDFNNNWKLDVIGWSREDYLKVYKEAPTSIKGRINFHGRLDGVKKSNILRNTQFFIFLTRYNTEAQPLTVIEALYANCIVLINEFKMMRDFLNLPNVYNFADLQTELDLNNIIQNKRTRDKSLDLSLEKYSPIYFKKNMKNAFN